MKKTRRFFAVLLSALLLISSMPLAALADGESDDISYIGEPTTTVVLYIHQNLYTVNGETRVSDTAPVIKNNRTFVPFRLVAEALGAEVEWVPERQQIITSIDDIKIFMSIGSAGIGTEHPQFGRADGILDVAPYINSDNRTMVPLRALAEHCGCNVTPHYAADGTTESVVFTR